MKQKKDLTKLFTTNHWSILCYNIQKLPETVPAYYREVFSAEKECERQLTDNRNKICINTCALTLALSMNFTDFE